MKCPTCGEELPLLSKVCPVCGCVIDDQREGGISAVSYIESLESKLGEMKVLPMPSFGQVFRELQIAICPLFALACFALALVTDAGLFWLLSVVFVAVWVVVLVSRCRRKPNFKRYKIEFEKEMNSAQRYFGKNREMGKELERLSLEVDDLEHLRKTMRRRSTVLWAVILLVLLGCILYLILR